MKAIPTAYRGATFRSRLEARWAAFFDLIGWRWTYEPYDLEKWAPDFLIHGTRQLLIEVKPYSTFAELDGWWQSHQASGLANDRPFNAEVLVVGITPTLSIERYWNKPAVGVLEEEVIAGASVRNVAVWNVCGACDALSIHSDIHSWACRPCGHHDGDAYVRDCPEARIERLWNEAHALTRFAPA